MNYQDPKLERLLKDPEKITQRTARTIIDDMRDTQGSSLGLRRFIRTKAENLPSKDNPAAITEASLKAGIDDMDDSYSVGVWLTLITAAIGTYYGLKKTKDDYNKNKPSTGGSSGKTTPPPSKLSSNDRKRIARVEKKVEEAKKAYEKSLKERTKKFNILAKKYAKILKSEKKHALFNVLKFAGMPTLLVGLLSYGTSEKFRKWANDKLGIKNIHNYMINGKYLVDYLSIAFDKIRKGGDPKKVLKELTNHFRALMEIKVVTDSVNKGKKAAEHIDPVTINRFHDVQFGVLVNAYINAHKDKKITKLGNLQIKSEKEARDIYAFIDVLFKQRTELQRLIKIFIERNADFHYLNMDNISLRGVVSLLYIGKQGIPFYDKMGNIWAFRARMVGVPTVRISLGGRIQGKSGLGMVIFPGGGEKRRTSRILETYAHKTKTLMERAQKLQASIQNDPGVKQAMNDVGKKHKALIEAQKTHAELAAKTTPSSSSAERLKYQEATNKLAQAQMDYDMANKRLKIVSDAVLSAKDRTRLERTMAELGAVRTKAANQALTEGITQIKSVEVKMQALQQQIDTASKKQLPALKAKMKAAKAEIQTIRGDMQRKIAAAVHLNPDGNLRSTYEVFSISAADDFARFVRQNKNILSKLDADHPFWKKMSQDMGWDIDKCRNEVDIAIKRAEKWGTAKSVIRGDWIRRSKIIRGTLGISMGLSMAADYRKGNTWGMVETAAGALPIIGTGIDFYTAATGYRLSDPRQKLTTNERWMRAGMGAASLFLSVLKIPGVVMKLATRGGKSAKFAGAIFMKRGADGVLKLRATGKLAKMAANASVIGRRGMVLLTFPLAGVMILNHIPGLNKMTNWETFKKVSGYGVQKTTQVFSYLYHNFAKEDYQAYVGKREGKKK